MICWLVSCENGVVKMGSRRHWAYHTNYKLVEVENMVNEIKEFENSYRSRNNKSIDSKLTDKPITVYLNMQVFTVKFADELKILIPDAEIKFQSMESNKVSTNRANMLRQQEWIYNHDYLHGNNCEQDTEEIK